MEIRSLLALSLLLLGPATQAAEPNSPEAGALACAEALSIDTGTPVFEVVKLNAHSGPGNYSIWMNTGDASLGTYCETERGSVSATYVQPQPWSGTVIRRPVTQDLATAY